MKIQFTVVLAIFLGLLSHPMFLFSQSPVNDDWAGIRALSAGTKVSIETKDGKTLKGELGAVSETFVSISSKGKTESVESSNLKALYTYGKSSMGRNIAIGAGVGAGAGAGIGLAAVLSTGGSDDVGAVIAPIILVGAGVGALLGALSGKKKKILVYEAK